MRVIVAALFVLVGCDGGGEGHAVTSDAAVDAFDACAQPPALIPLGATCKTGGLSNLELDGTWTFTGTATAKSHGTPPEPYSAEMVIEHSHTGWCGLTLSFPPAPNSGTPTHPTYNDDTFVSYSYYVGERGYTDRYWYLCVDANDDSLVFDEYNVFYMGGGQWVTTYHGVLTR